MRSRGCSIHSLATNLAFLTPLEHILSLSILHLTTARDFNKFYAVADPGFPVGGGGVDPLGGRGPLTWVLFGKNVCENERIWSRRGGGACARHAPTRSANAAVLPKQNIKLHSLDNGLILQRLRFCSEQLFSRIVNKLS